MTCEYHSAKSSVFRTSRPNRVIFFEASSTVESTAAPLLFAGCCGGCFFSLSLAGFLVGRASAPPGGGCQSRPVILANSAFKFKRHLTSASTVLYVKRKHT